MSFKLNKYNNYISIGYNCFTSMLLNNLKLRKEAYPLDWVVCTPEWVLKYFKTNFKNYYLPNEIAQNNYLGQEFYWERHHKMAEANHFHCENNTSDNSLSIYQDNRNKYERRIERINKLLNTKESILFIYQAEYSINSSSGEKIELDLKMNEDKYHNDLINLKTFFKSKYPEQKIDILVIYYNSNKYETQMKNDNIFIFNIDIPKTNDDKINRENVEKLLAPIF